MKSIFYTLSLFLFIYGSIQAQDVLSKGQAIDLVLENNFGILVAKNQVDIAENNKSVLNSGYLPTLSGNAGASYNRDDSVIEFPGQLNNDGTPRADVEIDQAESQRYNAGLNLNYTLFDGLGRFYNYKVLKEQYQLSELQARETIETTIVQMFSVYFEVARISENIRVLEETFQNTSERLNRAEYAFQYGQNNKLDVLNAEVDLVNDSISLMNERQLLLNTKRDLNVVLNRELENSFEVDTTVTFVETLLLDEIMGTAEENNVSLLQAQTNMNINDYTLKSAKSVFLPTIGLTGSYGWNLNQSAASAFFPGTNNSTYSFGLGASLTWNIFDGGRSITEIKNARIRLDNQDLFQQQLRQEVRRDIANARGNYINRLNVYHLQEKNVATATNNYERSNERYKLGLITSVELRQAQINLLNASTSKNLAKYNAKLAELQLLQLTGQLLNTEL